MGGEALCREAAMVVGIDRSPAACRLVRENWQRLAAADRFEVVCGDLVKKMATLAGERFDRIYFDPPYIGDLYLPVMSAIVTKKILAVDGEMAVESAASLAIPFVEGLTLVTRKKYGNTAVSFYRIEEDI
jgi:16S rRNA (guanine(966)-N(2))-methyltransferase RsmD